MKPEPNTPVLEARQLTKSYRKRAFPWQRGESIDVITGADLTVHAGEWVALRGPSGCGKTTLLCLLGTLDRPDSGELRCLGEDAVHMNVFRRARLRNRHIGFVFQSYQLFPELNALENVMLAGRLGRWSLAVCRERALHLLERVGLHHRLDHLPTEMSGGEQQRIALARALINDPDLILADEPTGNLDETNARHIMEVLRELRQQEHKSIVMVTHDPDLTAYADRTCVLRDGRVCPES